MLVYIIFVNYWMTWPFISCGIAVQNFWVSDICSYSNSHLAYYCSTLIFNLLTVSKLSILITPATISFQTILHNTAGLFSWKLSDCPCHMAVCWRSKMLMVYHVFCRFFCWYILVITGFSTILAKIRVAMARKATPHPHTCT